MLRKTERLSAGEVREILKVGRIVRGETATVRFSTSTKRKAAVVVSSKIVKGAVGRNRVRRLVYRTLAASLPRNVAAAFIIKNAKVTSEDIQRLCLKLS